MTPREVVDVDGCLLTIEAPDSDDIDAVKRGAVVRIGATCWLGDRKQLDQLIAKLVETGNELDRTAKKEA